MKVFKTWLVWLGNEILVMEKHQVTLARKGQAPTSVALTCMPKEKPIEEWQDKEKIPQENKI